MKENPSCEVNFQTALAEKAQLVNSVIMELINKQSDIEPHLKEAIIYTLNTPGKRIRAALVFWCCELVSGKISHDARIAAAAIEMVHTYSLVHDDLPAMDNDDLRRGKPTCHKAYNEAIAILTGDALLTLAFEIIAAEVEDPAVAIRLIKTLSRVAGPAGMIAGQMADLENENSKGNMLTLQHIHINKTAKMFAGAAAMGAIAGQADDEQIETLLDYGLKLGLVFQVADDILDVAGDSEHIGKTAGKDQQQGKVTYPSVVGMEESKRIAEKITDQAIRALDVFDQRADILRQLAKTLQDRTR